jgi:four helix bundle protein
MTQGSILTEKSIDFAIRMAKCYQYLMNDRQEFIMSKQMFRSGTSIGANVHEGIQAQSKADFVNKYSIALKEASETSYWLVVLHRSQFLDDNLYMSLKQDIDELIRLLVSSIKAIKKSL